MLLNYILNFLQMGTRDYLEEMREVMQPASVETPPFTAAWLCVRGKNVVRNGAANDEEGQQFGVEATIVDVVRANLDSMTLPLHRGTDAHTLINRFGMRNDRYVAGRERPLIVLEAPAVVNYPIGVVELVEKVSKLCAQAVFWIIMDETWSCTQVAKQVRNRRWEVERAASDWERNQARDRIRELVDSRDGIIITEVKSDPVDDVRGHLAEGCKAIFDRFAGPDIVRA